jgi:putative cell wall-binding protein
VLLDGSLNLSNVFSPTSSSGCVIAEQQPPFTITEPRFTPDGRTVVFKGITQTSTTASTAALYSVPAACAGTSPTPTKISADDVYANFDLGPNVTVRRAGATRIETAVATSQAAFASAPTVVVARSDSYADGLAGAPLAGKAGGPLLLTPRDGLPATVGAEVTRLGATRAIILGDEGVVGPAVAASLRDRGLTVERLAGADRFATAAAVAERVGGKEAYLASGFDPDPARGWPDALSVSGLAALDHHPVLLVTQDKLPPATANALTAMGVTKVTIIGGTAAVSDAVAAAVRATGASVDRVAGADRYATSRAVADKAIAGGASVARSWVATGANWPDALAGGPAAANGSGPFLLVPPTEDAGSTEWFASRRAAGSRIEMLGGPGVLPPAVRQALERAVTG